MATLMTRASRTGRIESAEQDLPILTGKYLVLSDIGATDLADPNKWVRMMIDVKDATVPGGWRLDAGGFVVFQCGPTVVVKGGPLVPAGANRGFTVNVAAVSGRTIRGVVELREFGPTGAFTTMVIGVTGTRVAA
jgi:hypothetical protein